MQAGAHNISFIDNITLFTNIYLQKQLLLLSVN